MAGPADRTVEQEGPRRPRPAGLLGNRAVLLVVSPNFFGRSHVIERNPTVIGREEGCDFVIPDPLASRRHCRLTVEQDGEYMIEDLSSTNATVLNAKRLARKSRIHYGDRIIIGDTVLRFFVEEQVERKA